MFTLNRKYKFLFLLPFWKKKECIIGVYLHLCLCTVSIIPTEDRGGHQIFQNWSYCMGAGNQTQVCSESITLLSTKLSLQLQEFSLEMIFSGSDRVNIMLLVSQHTYTFVWRCSSFIKLHLKFIFEICFKTFLYSLACLIPLALG